MRLFVAWRVSAITEGLSYLLLLLVAMPLKYIYGIAEAVRLVGAIHGGLFILFMALLIAVYLRGTMTLKQCAAAFVASLLPFGAFAFDAYIKQRVPASATA